MPAIGPYAYPFDPTGADLANQVTGEVQVVTAVNSNEYHIVVPNFAPFYRASLIALNGGTMTTLVEGVDFIFTHKYKEATINTALPIYGSITLLNKNFSGIVLFQEYQTVGGQWTLTTTQINQILADKMLNPRITTWEQLGVAPEHFPVINHLHVDPEELIGMPELVEAVENIAVAVDGIVFDIDYDAINAYADSKVQDSMTPTQTTKAPSVRAVQEALDLKADIGALDDKLDDVQLVQDLLFPAADTIPSTVATASALNAKLDDSQLVQDLTAISPVDETKIPSVKAVKDGIAAAGSGLTTGVKGDIDVNGVDTDWQIVPGAIEFADLNAALVVENFASPSNSTIPSSLAVDNLKGAIDGFAPLDALLKIPASYLPSTSSLNYLGQWNALTNTPDLTIGSYSNGDFYIVSVANPSATVPITESWNVGDWIIYNGTVWEKVDNSNSEVQNSLTPGSIFLAPSVDVVNTALAAKAVDADVVHKTGSLPETITGTKTFSVSPILPDVGVTTGTNDDSAASTQFVQNVRGVLQASINDRATTTYVDAQLAGKLDDNQLVNSLVPNPSPDGNNSAPTINAVNSGLAGKVSKTGNESVDGIKTFTSSPLVPTVVSPTFPADNLKAANLEYVEDALIRDPQILHMTWQNASGNGGGTNDLTPDEGVDSGDSDPQFWHLRKLNTLIQNTIPGASVVPDLSVSGKFNLPAGRYRVKLQSSNIKLTRARLALKINPSTSNKFDNASTSNLADLRIPSIAIGDDADNVVINHEDILTLTDPTTQLGVYHWFYGKGTNPRLGIDSSSGLPNVFLDVKIQKIG